MVKIAFFRQVFPILEVPLKYDVNQSVIFTQTNSVKIYLVSFLVKEYVMRAHYSVVGYEYA